MGFVLERFCYNVDFDSMALLHDEKFTYKEFGVNMLYWWQVAILILVFCYVTFRITRFLEQRKYHIQKQKNRAYWQQKERENKRLEEEHIAEKLTPEYKLKQRLENLKTGNISTKRIMNNEEFSIYFALHRIFKDDYIISPQVSFKAFLNAELESWKAFSDFYCDFLVTYKRGGQTMGKPVAVIEYHGGSHYGVGDNAEIKQRIQNNDYVKQILFSKIEGINLFVIRECDIKQKDSIKIDDARLQQCLLTIKNEIVVQTHLNY